MANNRRNGSKGKTHSKPQFKSTPTTGTGTAKRAPEPVPAKTIYNTTSRPSAMEAKPTRVEITQQTVAEAAYYLWLRRGGDEISNWLEAERQLRHGSMAGR